jgi:hypothetical protein
MIDAEVEICLFHISVPFKKNLYHSYLRHIYSMRFYLVIFLFLMGAVQSLYAQSEISGRWLSADAQRVYYVYRLSDSLYEAKLIDTKRAGEDTGSIVLKHVFYNSKRRRYDGLIYSVTDKYLVRRAKIEPDIEGNTLLFTLPRMLFFNVHVKWYRQK